MMESTFQNRVFLVILVIGFASVMILYNQSGYLSRHRLFDQSQDHSHRSRMRMHRSQESLRHYQAWSHNKHSLQDAKDAVIPQEEDISLQYYRAWSKKQHALLNLKEATFSREDDRPLHFYRVWSENQRYVKDAKEATISRKKVEVFNKINITKTNNKRWINSSHEHCTPRKNIVFLKMHKCSSSTVQNILFRYGERHQLDFVLPPTHNILARTLFESRYMLHFPVKEYNILCHHTLFSAEGFAEVMAANAVYTTIIRDPVQTYESSFTYNDIAFRFNLPPENGLEQFMQMPLFYYRRNIYTNAYVKNPMLYDLGLAESAQFSPEKINQKILELIEQFDLVMITEHFDESLILLRHLMCWEIDDMVYFVHNARSRLSVQTLSADLVEKIRDWNSGDVKLYDAFNQTFWKRVETFGMDRMQEEVLILRERIEYFYDYCISKVVDDDVRVWHPYGIKIDSFKLRSEARHDLSCQRMVRTELPYTQKLRFVQLRRYNMIESADVML